MSGVLIIYASKTKAVVWPPPEQSSQRCLSTYLILLMIKEGGGRVQPEEGPVRAHNNTEPHAVREESNPCTMTNAHSEQHEHHKYNLTDLPTELT